MLDKQDAAGRPELGDISIKRYLNSKSHYCPDQFVQPCG